MNDNDNGILIVIGTQSQGPDGGIHAACFDETAGALQAFGLAATATRPTWVLADFVRPVLYAVKEVGNTGDRIGDVMSFAIDRSSAGLCSSTIARIPIRLRMTQGADEVPPHNPLTPRWF